MVYTEIFTLWIKEIFIPYQETIGEKCLLILDKAISHISRESLKYLNDLKINKCFNPIGYDSRMSILRNFSK